MDLDDARVAHIRTPDQRLRVFVSSTLRELAQEREAVRAAVLRLRLTPVMFESGARPHPPRPLYRAYLAQSDIFIGIYWQRYGWVAPGEEISGLEDEYRLSGDRPKLIYVKTPAPGREPELTRLLDRIRDEDGVSYKPFETAEELRDLVENDLALVLTESFAEARVPMTGEATRTVHDNLPVQRGSIVDRKKETAALRDLLLRDDVGMVTLTGVGGTGKTRLALHVAATVRESFADGVVFVPLASLADWSLIPSAIAQALDLREVPGQSLAETLENYLRAKHLLLVLDNFEHLLDAGPLVGRLLEHCPHLTVLVTSRSLLHLYEEREIAVPPLGLPDRDVLPELAHLSQYAAVELFIQRAREVKPDFQVTNASAPALSEICQRLDGLPLAIELAAARARLFPPRALLSRLNRRLPLLVAGARDLPQRQQTLRGATEWSYDLLDDHEKQLFRRLSVFVGGFTLDAAEAVCRDGSQSQGGSAEVSEEASPAPVVVESLLDKSLLWVQEGTGGEPRFGMLETIREYGRVRLAESGEEAETIARHAQWFLQLVEAAEPKRWGADRPKWMDLLNRELDNLRAVLRRSLLQGGPPDVGVNMVTRLPWFWLFSGRSFAEGLEWLRAALAAAPAATHPIERAKILWGIGGLNYVRGDLAEAEGALEESIALLRGRDDAEAIDLAGSLTILGAILTATGRSSVAQPLLEESLGLCRSAGDRFWESYTLYAVGQARLTGGDTESATAVFQEGLDIAESLDNPWCRLVLVAAQAGLAARQNQPQAAFDRFSEAIQLSASQDMYGHTLSVMGAASAALQLQDYERSERLWKEGLRISQELGNAAYSLVALASLADVALLGGNVEASARLFGAVEGRLKTMGPSEVPIVASLFAETRYQTSLEDRLQEARATLTSPQELAAWQEGESMSLEQVALLSATADLRVPSV